MLNLDAKTPLSPTRYAAKEAELLALYPEWGREMCAADYYPRREVLTPEEYDAKVQEEAAKATLALAQQRVAQDYIRAVGGVPEDAEATAPEDRRQWFAANREALRQRMRGYLPEEPAWASRQRDEGEPPTESKGKGTLRPMNHTLRNLMPGRARESYTLFERWADPEGRFFCSSGKLARLLTGRAKADKKTGQRLLSLHRAAGVIRVEKTGKKGVRANGYRLARLIDHGLAARVYRQHREAAREQLRALGVEDSA